MPNLDHDPQNPTDLLDRPIKVGDIVAWGTTWGRSPAVAVARIHKIRFIAKDNGKSWGKNIEVPQKMAEDYQLVLEVIKSTGSVSYPTQYHPNGYTRPDGSIGYFEQLSDKPKLKTIQLVKNVVKLEDPGT